MAKKCLFKKEEADIFVKQPDNYNEFDLAAETDFDLPFSNVKEIGAL